MSLSDDFNRADANDLGANWTDLTGGMRIVSNTARSENAGAYNWSYWSANSWNADQTSQITYIGSPDCGPIVRAADAAGGGDGYMLMTHATNGFRIYRRDNGGFTLLQDIGNSVANSDTSKLEITGSTLKAYKNGAQIGTDQSDGTYSSGSAGIYNVGDTSVTGVDDWVGTGEVAGGGGITGPLVGGGHLLDSGPLVSGRLVA